LVQDAELFDFIGEHSVFLIGKFNQSFPLPFRL
jgi:hypothetical protein